jgi:ribosomal-protein-alanine N-acetyltransferase
MESLMHIIFATERLIVRRYESTDADNFYSLSGNEEVMRYIRATSSRADSDQFLKDNIFAYNQFPLRGRWAVIDRQEHQFIGSFAIIPIPNQPQKIQLGYSLLPVHWGKGYATELTKAGIDYYFETHREEIIYAVTEIPNLASQNVLLKAGFQKAGTFIEEGKELLLFEYSMVTPNETRPY